VPFRPEALLLYASLWVYVSIAPALLKNFRELFSYGVATLALSAIGLASFSHGRPRCRRSKSI